MTFALLVALALAVPATPSAQSPAPLGISKGMSIQQLIAKGGKADANNIGWYDFAKTPVPDLDIMSVLATPKTGACKVFGLVAVKANRSGTQVRQKFDSFVERLTKKYGPPQKTLDMALPGALYDEEHEFMNALAQEERYLWSLWDEASALPPDITSIAVRAQANEPSSAAIGVTYEFSNLGECVSILKAQEADAL